MPELSTHSTVAEILCELIAIPSVNPMGRDVNGPIYYEHQLSDWLVKFFRSIGARHERIEVADGRDNVIARYDSPGSDITLLLDVHQDTVPVEGMTVPPFEPHVADGRITGRGACDVKGGMAAMLHAFRRLVLEQPASAANVILSCTVDEEATTLGITDLVRLWQHPDGRSQLLQPPPDGAIVAEPTDLDVVVAHRGVTRFLVRTSGRACHSSDPTQGVNAIYRMAQLVSCLEQYADHVTTSTSAHPLCGSPTLSVGRIEGGTSVNIVPDECTIEVDRRVIPGEDRQAVTADVQEFLRSRLNFDFELAAPWLESPPLSDAENRWLAESLLSATDIVAGPHQAVGVPYGTHASRTAAAGVPSVVFGPGSIDQAHTKDEFIAIAQLNQAAEVYYQLCANPPKRP